MIRVFIFVSFLLAFSLFASSSYKTNDSTRGINLMETDFFYLSLIPENYEVRVGVSGSGIDMNLPWLQPFLYVNPNEIENGVDDDNSGVVDDVYGGSLVRGIESSPTNEMSDLSSLDWGHETVISSIIASSAGDPDYPSLFGVSFTPDNIKIIPIRFLDDYGAWDEQHSWSINYAVSRNVHIINASYGFGGGVTPLSQAVHDEYEKLIATGATIVASAGNTSYLKQYPCAYDETICVGGVTYEKELVSLSSWGFNDFVSYKNEVNVLSKQGTIYWQSNGTSFSAPQITAAIAKIMSYTGNYDRDYSYNLLKKHAVPIDDFYTSPTFTGNRGGHGFVDFKGLAEEFITIHTKNVVHADNENIVYQIVYSTDKASADFYRGFIRYVFINGQRFSLYKELVI